MPISKRPSRAVATFGSALPSPREGIRYTIDEARNKYERFFRHFGVSLRVSSSGEQFNGDCPFPDCVKPQGHFYVSVSRGQWDCKHCGESGNTYSFMDRLLRQYRRRMTDTDYQWLVKKRPGISADSFKMYGICRFGPSSVLLPSKATPSGEKRSSTGILNLPIWREMSSDDGTVSMRIMNPPIVAASLFGLQYWKPRAPTYICEGQWDVLALHSLFLKLPGKSSATLASECNIIGVPGTTNYPSQYLSLLSGLDIYILFDNDSAGLTGQDKLISSISNEGIVPRSVHAMSWPAHFDTGFDLRDLIHKGVL